MFEILRQCVGFKMLFLKLKHFISMISERYVSMFSIVWGSVWDVDDGILGDVMQRNQRINTHIYVI